MSINMKNSNIFSKKRKKKMKNYKPYCNTPETHSGNLILAKKKSSKSVNVSDTLSQIGKLSQIQTSISKDVQPLPRSHLRTLLGT